MTNNNGQQSVVDKYKIVNLTKIEGIEILVITEKSDRNSINVEKLAIFNKPHNEREQIVIETIKKTLYNKH